MKLFPCFHLLRQRFLSHRSQVTCIGVSVHAIPYRLSLHYKKALAAFDTAYKEPQLCAFHTFGEF
jgi:hypothetical protein